MPKAKSWGEEEYKTGTAGIPGVLNSTKENLKVYCSGDPSSKIEVVRSAGCTPHVSIYDSVERSLIQMTIVIQCYHTPIHAVIREFYVRFARSSPAIEGVVEELPEEKPLVVGPFRRSCTATLGT